MSASASHFNNKRASKRSFRSSSHLSFLQGTFRSSKAPFVPPRHGLFYSGRCAAALLGKEIPHFFRNEYGMEAKKKFSFPHLFTNIAGEKCHCATEAAVLLINRKRIFRHRCAFDGPGVPGPILPGFAATNHDFLTNMLRNFPSFSSLTVT